MTDATRQTVTQLLRHFNARQPGASDELFRHVYDHLYLLAKKQRQKWSGDNTLNTTALLHETYLKLVEQDLDDHQSRAHFYATASKAMRHILVTYARDQKRQKRGGDNTDLTLDEFKLIAGEEMEFPNDHPDLLLILEKALKRLEKVNIRYSRIIECRFFGGMTIEDTAAALGVSSITVKRGWNASRLWLYREMQKGFGKN